jgi:hypothetical protein
VVRQFNDGTRIYVKFLLYQDVGKMIKRPDAKPFSVGILSLAFGYCCFNNTVFWHAIFAGWVVDLCQPCPVFDQSQKFQCGKILNGLLARRGVILTLLREWS